MVPLSKCVFPSYSYAPARPGKTPFLYLISTGIDILLTLIDRVFFQNVGHLAVKMPVKMRPKTSQGPSLF